MSSPTAPEAQAPLPRPLGHPSSPPPGQTVGPSLVKKIDLAKNKLSLKVVVIALGIVVAGIASGFGLNLATSGSIGIKSTTEASGSGVKVGDVVGVADQGTFKDSAIGVLVRGGVDGEGSHHLLREGGPDQTAYLTSSVVDLNLFEDHKVEVWGETFDAQKAGWLMDVGRVKVLELNAPPPFEEAEE